MNTGIQTSTSHTAQQQSGRVPPHDYQAERAVLATILLDDQALQDVVEMLNQHDFYRKRHALIFKAALELNAQGVEVDLVSLGQKMKQENLLTEIGGVSYIAGLTETITSGANAQYFAAIVKDLSLRRSLLTLCGSVATNAFNRDQECRAILEDAESQLFQITNDSIQEKPQSVREIVTSTYAAIEKRATSNELITGIPTGFQDVDSILSGLHDSEFIVIGARPSVGKTALTISIMSHIAITNQIPTAFFSLEMTGHAIMQRLLAKRSKISATKLRTGLLKAQELSELQDAIDPIYHAPLWIVDTPRLQMINLRTIARRLIREQGVRIIFIDYLTLISADTLDLPRHEQVASISRSLKAMAHELEIPVVVLSQVTRDTEGRKPTLASIRESGSIEQDADVVIFLHRDSDTDEHRREQRDRSIPESIETDLVVAKQRNGPVGTVKLQFIPRFVSFEETARTITQ